MKVNLEMNVDLLSLLRQDKIVDNGTHSTVVIILNKILRIASSPIVHSLIILLCILHVILCTVIKFSRLSNKYEIHYCQIIYSLINKILSFYCIYDSTVILAYICKLLKIKRKNTRFHDEYIIFKNSMEFLINLSVSILNFTGFNVDIIGIAKILSYLINWKRLSIFLRKQVGQNKRFYTNDEYCLDLVFITDRIIAMGLPALNIEAIYRNPIEEVSKFFMTKYPKNHMIINLCNEREHYSFEYFHSIVSCPFPDHQVPTIGSLFIICFLILNYLVNDKRNIVAIHCKGGKGRTGIVVVAWLLYSKIFNNVEEALEYYSKRRTDLTLPGGLKTIKNPSQIRFVRYFFFLLRNSFPTSVVRHGSNFFWEDLQRGFRSGYFWNISVSELKRINHKHEKRHWKISDLTRDQCIYLPRCLTQSVGIYPVLLNIKNSELDEIYEWRIYLHSEYNRNGDYLTRNISSTLDWNYSLANYSINPNYTINSNNYCVYSIDDSNNMKLFENYFDNKDQILSSIKSKIESLLSDLETRPFTQNIISRSSEKNQKDYLRVWLDREFAIKIFGNNNIPRHSKKDLNNSDYTNNISPNDSVDESNESESNDCTPFLHGNNDSRFGELSRKMNQLNYEKMRNLALPVDSEENSHLLRSISLIDISNPDKKAGLDKEMISSLNSPYKDIVDYPIKKINEWSTVRQTFSDVVPLAHIWLFPALIHTTNDSNFWTFFVEWEDDPKTWVIRDCFLSVTLKTKKEIDVRSSCFNNVTIKITFQYK